MAISEDVIKKFIIWFVKDSPFKDSPFIVIFFLVFVTYAWLCPRSFERIMKRLKETEVKDVNN